jgi:hypothetical protein
LRRLWEVKGDDAWLENCLVKMWNANVHYWKTPNANRKSERMHIVCATAKEPIAQRRTPLAHFMEL